MTDEARTEAELRQSLVLNVERAYLTMTDKGEPSEEWDPITLEALADAVVDGAELKSRFGDAALRAALVELEALGDMRAEIYAVAVDYIARGED